MTKWNQRITSVILATALCLSPMATTESGLWNVQEAKAAVTSKITVKQKYLTVRIGKKIKLTKYVSVSGSNSMTYRAGKAGKSTALKVASDGTATPIKGNSGKTVRVYVAPTGNRAASKYLIVKILPKIDPKKKMIALTYDDGPNTTSTKRIANTIEKYNGSATFFVLGSLLGSTANRAEIRTLAKQGMQIGSHTQNHLQLTALSSGKLASEINQTDNMLKNLLGTKPRLVRTPYGAYNSTVLNAINRPMIMWSIDTLDWKTRNANSTYNSVMNQAQDGSIVLMHCIYDASAAATERIVPALIKKGYQLVSVSEMYHYRGKHLKNAQVYNGF